MMEHGPNNTKLEKLMEDPQKQEEFIEELRKSQLFLPVIFSENMFEGIEDSKPGETEQFLYLQAVKRWKREDLKALQW